MLRFFDGVHFVMGAPLPVPPIPPAVVPPPLPSLPVAPPAPAVLAAVPPAPAAGAPARPLPARPAAPAAQGGAGGDCAGCRAPPAPKTTARVTTTTVGPVLFVHATDSTGQTYHGAGVTTAPGFGVSTAQCAIFPRQGQTANDVITGWSVGASAAAPGLSPEISGSANASGAMACLGPSLGTGGAGGTFTVMTDQPFPQTVQDFNAIDRARMQPYLDTLHADRAREAAALAEFDPKNYTNGVFRAPAPGR